MSTTAVAQLLSNTLYFRRFFPYYAFNVVAGVDSEGEPPAPRASQTRALTHRDLRHDARQGRSLHVRRGGLLRAHLVRCAGRRPEAHYSRARQPGARPLGGRRAGPVGDCAHAAPPQIGHKHRQDQQRELSAEEVVEIVKDLFVTAGERDIYTGDAVDLYVIRADGVENISFDLKKD